MPAEETCTECTGPVLLMSRKGTGLCSIVCEKAAGKGHPSERPAMGSADLANATERPRNEPECTTS